MNNNRNHSLPSNQSINSNTPQRKIGGTERERERERSEKEWEREREKGGGEVEEELEAV